MGAPCASRRVRTLRGGLGIEAVPNRGSLRRWLLTSTRGFRLATTSWHWPGMSERLLGSAPSFVAGPTEAVWELAEHRSISIEERVEHPGHAMHTVFVDDLDSHVAQIASRGVDPVERETYSNGVRKVTYRDPDGNEIGFGGGSRGLSRRPMRSRRSPARMWPPMHGTGVGTQERTQLESERLDTVSKGHLEPLDRRPQHRGLVGEVGVHGVGRNADLSGDAPHRHRGGTRSNEAVRTSVVRSGLRDHELVAGVVQCRDDVARNGVRLVTATIVQQHDRARCHTGRDRRIYGRRRAPASPSDRRSTRAVPGRRTPPPC